MLSHYLFLAQLSIDGRNNDNPEDSHEASAPVEHAVDEDGHINHELSVEEMGDNSIVRQGNLYAENEVRDDLYLDRRVPDAYQGHIERNPEGNLLDQVVPQAENENVIISNRVQLQTNLDLQAEEESASIMEMDEGLCRS